MPTAYLTHADYLTHDTGPFHPETPARLERINTRLDQVRRQDHASPLHRLVDVTPYRADIERITAVHASQYVDAVARWCRQGYSDLPTGDTAICRASYDVALLAAGAGLAAVDAVLNGQTTNAFCAVRPPGHHAERDRGMGFCIFNNVAVAAWYAQNHYGLERVLIIDWDVHHGNGTQQIFADDPTVFYMSIHQSPLYPFTGMAWETGVGKGEGYTLNVPVSPGTGDDVYFKTFEERFIPTAMKFHPDCVFISTGFDAHRDDPLSHTLVTEDGFTTLTQMVVDLARACCGRRLVSMLEGGYNLDALALCVERHLTVLAQA